VLVVGAGELEFQIMARTSILVAWVVASFSCKPTLALYLSSQSTREYNSASLTLLSLDKIISCCE